MPNNPSELFPFMRMAGLWPKSKAEFVDKFCFGFHDGYRYKITGAKNLPLLKKMLAPVTLRRLRSDIATVQLSIGSVSVEAREVDPLSPVLKHLALEEPALAAMVRLHLADDTLDAMPIDAASTVRRLIGIAKSTGMAEIASSYLDQNPDAKIVIFGIHRNPLRYLRALLRPYDPILLFGGVGAKTRDRLVHAFQQNHKRRVFIGNMSTAGIGIDLSMADMLYIFEPSWTPADNAQALSRIINIRKPEPKEAMFVGLANSIDDAVTRVYERKARDIEGLFSAV